MKTLMVDYKAPGVAAPGAARKDDNDQGLAFTKTQKWAKTKKTLACFGYGKKGHVLNECNLTSKKERQNIWDTEIKGFRKDTASTTSSTRTKANKTMGVINQTVEEVSLSEEEDDEGEKGAVYTKACIEYLMTLGQ